MGLKNMKKHRVPKTTTRAKKKKIKDTQKLKKKVGSTLKWMEIEEIQEHQMILKKGNKTTFVRGIKLHPINIFIEDEYEQYQRIGRLRNVYNKINYKMYHSFVFNPVNLDSELAYLSSRLENETSPAMQELIQDDIEKAIMFIRDFHELEFFITVQNSSEKQIKKMMDELVYEFERAGFQLSPLNIIDFENYSAYVFENQMINDYLFGRGAFEILSQESEGN